MARRRGFAHFSKLGRQNLDSAIEPGRWVRSRGLEFRMKVHTLEDRARDENRSPDDPVFTLDRTGSELGNK